MTDRLDLRELRTGLKLLRDTGESELYRNMDGIECPACGRSFDDLLATEARHRRFDPPAGVGLCVRREEGRLLVFTHES